MQTGDFQNPFGTTVLLGLEFMIGSIVIWSGLLADIPAGWQICDGTNGTPDLTGKFVKGAAGDVDRGDTGGALTHSHPFTGNGHDHNLVTGTGKEVLPGGGLRDFTSTDSAVGTTDTADSQPPWYKLMYIQRMS